MGLGVEIVLPGDEEIHVVQGHKSYAAFHWPRSGRPNIGLIKLDLCFIGILAGNLVWAPGPGLRSTSLAFL